MLSAALSCDKTGETDPMATTVKRIRKNVTFMLFFIILAPFFF